MRWNWDPARWKRRTKLLLGFVTVWPVIYIGLFILFAFSMVLLMSLVARSDGQSANCGDLDVLQLDRKIKNGEIKQLTARPREFVSIDREGNCSYETSVSSPATRNDILREARELVNGRPRVEKVEEETAEPEMGWFMPAGFAGFFVVHMLTILLMLALTPLYIILAVKNESLDQTMRIVWVVLACTVGMASNAVYWYLYIWRQPPVPTTSGPEVPAPSVKL